MSNMFANETLLKKQLVIYGMYPKKIIIHRTQLHNFIVQKKNHLKKLDGL